MKTNRILCLLLTVVMLFTVVFQTGVFAEEPLLEEEYTQEDNEWPEAAALVDEYLDEEEDNENPAQVNEGEEELINEEDDRSEEMSDKEQENDPAGETLQNEPSLTASETVAFEIGAPATITKQPENATGSIGDTVTFAVEAENATAYVWQYSKDKGATWTSWTSEQYRQPTIELSLTKSRMTMKYRCQVTGEDGKNIYSDVVCVTAGAAAKITKQPENATGSIGDTVTFAVEAENATTYVWQYSKDKGATWTSWTSEQYRQPTIELSLTKSRMTMKYRCQVTGTDGKSIYSDVVGVTAGAAAKITKQPENATGSIGDTVTFAVEAENATAYVWQYSKDKGATWTSWTSEQYRQPTIELTLTKSRMTMKYRCQVTGTDGKSIYSDVVGVTAGAAAKITKQPENATGSIGDTVTFAVEAENATAYVWQYSKDNGATWTSWTSEQYRQPTIELSLTKSRMTMKYRCQVTGEDGKNIYSDVVGVTAGAAAKITKQPENAHGNVGDTVTFAVEAENATTYVWQYSKDNGTTWTSWTSEQYRQPTIELSLTKSRMTMKYRCQVTGTNGKSIYSDVVGVISSIVENDLIYKLNDDNTLTVIGYTGNAAAVVVPKTVEGHTVTAIGESAFEGMTFIQSVKLPETITIIMRRAFADCTSLREMS